MTAPMNVLLAAREWAEQHRHASPDDRLVNLIYAAGRADAPQGPTAPDLDAFRRAVRTRDRTVAEIVRRAHAIDLPMSIEQARLAYDVTREQTR